jgi:hypothetical protein
MTLATAQMSIFVDGFYAGPKHTDMQTWLAGPEAAGFFRITRWVDRRRLDGGVDHWPGQSQSLFATIFQMRPPASNHET